MVGLSDYTGYDYISDDNLTEDEKASIKLLPNGNPVCTHRSGVYMGLFDKGTYKVEGTDSYVWLLFEEWENENIAELLGEKV